MNALLMILLFIIGGLIGFEIGREQGKRSSITNLAASFKALSKAAKDIQAQMKEEEETK